VDLATLKASKGAPVTLRPGLLALCLFVAGSTARAEEPAPLGWTAKGDWFVSQLDQSNGGAGGTSVGSVSVVVWSPSGEQLTFGLRDYNDDKVTVDEDGAKKLAAWLKAHPLKAGQPTKVSPDGKVSTELTAKAATVKGWDAKNGGFEFEGSLIECPDGVAAMGGCGVNPGVLTALLVSGGTKRPAATFALQSRGGRVKPFWSPDGSHVAWLLDAAPANPFSGDPGYFQVVISGDGSLAIELVADVSLLRTVAPKVSKALQGAGFYPARIGKAVKKREGTVVYTAKGSEAVAKKIAGAIPGGASVEALTWKTDCEVVVAVGASAK
jgi:hypothetical protein